MWTKRAYQNWRTNISKQTIITIYICEQLKPIKSLGWKHAVNIARWNANNRWMKVETIETNDNQTQVDRGLKYMTDYPESGIEHDLLSTILAKPGEGKIV